MIGSFLNNFKGYGNQNFESQLRKVDDQVEEERRWFKKRIAKLAANRKEIVKNQRNAVKLSNLSAQLKEVQQDNSLDKMEESPLLVPLRFLVVMLTLERKLVVMLKLK